MSSPNNNKELRELLGYLRSDHPAAQPQHSRVAAENRQQNLVQPPAHIKESLRQKIAARGQEAASQSSVRDKLGLLLTGRQWYLAAAALLIAGILVGSFLPRRNQTLPILAMNAQPQQSAITLRSGQMLTDAGLTVTAAAGGAQILLLKSKKDHIFIQSGGMRIETQGQLLAAEPWFHTPHATITREGTSFTLDVTASLTRIDLHEGKLGVYTYAGKEIRKQTVEAPAKIELIHRLFAETEKPDFNKIESEIEKARNPPAQNSLAAEKPRKVTLILNNGDSVSGTVSKSDATYIYLQNPR